MQAYTRISDRIFAWLKGPILRCHLHNHDDRITRQPYRDSAERRVDQFYALLSTYPNLEWIAPDRRIADIAACLRAQYRLRTPDALQAATAVHAQVSGFITNDSEFRRVGAFETLLLDELL